MRAANELEGPGDCTKCGAYAQYGRNSAGQCVECHNAGYWEYRKRLAAIREQTHEEGRQWWAARGITVGDKVQCFTPHMLAMGGMMVAGVARVGAVGPYVHSKFQTGYLAPGGWRKA